MVIRKGIICERKCNESITSFTEGSSRLDNYCHYDKIFTSATMIESTSDFLDEVLGGIQKLKFFDPIFKETLTAKEHLIEEKREYVLRFSCVQAHFLRTAYMDKINFITRLLEEIETVNAISVLLGAVSQACGKMGTYIKTMTTTTFIYDKTFKSHNRSMSERALKIAQEEDIEWFCSLSESDKIPVVIGLMRMSSGALILKMQERLKPLLKKKLESSAPVETRVPVEETPQPKIGSKLDELLKPLIKGEYEEVQYDPKDPLTTEVQRLRRKWSDKLMAYVAQVAANDSKTKPQRRKSKKSSDSDTEEKKKNNKEKKKDKDKTNKEGVKKKKGSSDATSTDRIQLLPVWIIKRILSYLDGKTLATCKRVNEYWKYVVADYLKEVTVRAKLNKEIEIVEEKLTNALEKCKLEPQSTSNKKRISFQQKRFLKLTETACVSEKVRTRLHQPHTKSLISTAPKLLKNRYVLPVKYLLSFPRSTCMPYKLYKPGSAVCIENGYVHTIRGDLVAKEENPRLSAGQKNKRRSTAY